ncbi:hypothetical protein [Hufsiella ginkgonis]|uniref:Uncharacterized protein n=1 Tax=Hufsiella ginkgonis TaxID=2695274 RepID=A0A7K1XUG8_9SPHI|nr:hypothetical protein [Hufsiella ginkgonis]MXV14600.1 hypothetical protein [Hufsiella ginkgonis]
MMNTKEIIKKIGVIISELHDQQKFLAENPESLNEFELELLRANTHFLNDHIEILHRFSQAAPVPPTPAVQPPSPVAESEKPAHPAAAEKEEPVQEAAVEEEQQPSREWVFEPIKESLKTDAEPGQGEEPESAAEAPGTVTRHFLDAEPIEDGDPEEAPDGAIGDSAPEEAATEPEEEDETADEPVEPPQREENLEEAQPGSANEPEPVDPAPVKAPEPVAEEKAPEPAPAIAGPVVHEVVIRERTVAIDTLPGPAEAPAKAPTINELLSAGLKTSATAAQYTQPVSDIKSAVNLNDKLLFIKDLFNGYSLAYSEAMDMANRAGSYDAAVKFLEANYGGKNQWSAKQATVDKLYAIITRRFS